MEGTELTLTNTTTHVVLVGDAQLAWHGQHPLVPARADVLPALQEQGLDVGRGSSLAPALALASLKTREDQNTADCLYLYFMKGQFTLHHIGWLGQDSC